MKLGSFGTFAAMICVIGSVACSNTDRSRDTTAPPNGPAANDTGAGRADASRAAGSTARNEAVTLTGCLQKGDGRNAFILTRVNRPSEPVGTAGSGNAAGVERERLNAAKNAYRLDPQGDVKLDGLVGKQVTVQGTVTEPADIGAPNNPSRPSPGADSSARDDSNRTPTTISEGDLAKVDVSSATALSDGCGSSPKNRSRK